MTAPAHRDAAAFLRRAALFTAVLAIIAGIFGMHVLTATHAMHSPASATAVSPAHAGHPAAIADHGVPVEQDVAEAVLKQCAESGECTSMHAMTVACTPSAKTDSMAAPPPGTLVLGISNNTTPAGTGTGQWSYLPGSPSPCELSISRT